MRSSPPRSSDFRVHSLRPIGKTGPADTEQGAATVRNAAIVFRTTIVLALAAVSHAQRPAGITPEMINTTLPLEGAPLAVPGPYKVESGPAFGSPGHVVYRPADLAPFPAKDTLPLMVWGNGGCAINSTRYGGLLTRILSSCVVVVATAAEPGATGGAPHADKLCQGIG